MGPNGALRVTVVRSQTNSANTKSLRFRLGGLSGAQLMITTSAAFASFVGQRLIQNRNSQSSQVSGPETIVNSFNLSTGAIATAAIDTSVAQNFVISGQLANAGETLTLESHLVELAYGA